MKKYNLIKFIVFTLIVSVSCNSMRCIQGDSNMVTKVRKIGNFTSIRTQGSWEIEVVKANECSVEVIGESNILPFISTEISNNELLIRSFENTCWQENFPIRIIVYAPIISSILSEGSGDLLFDTLQFDHVLVNLKGSGNIYGRIEANSVDLRIDGSGDIKVNGTVNNATYDISGSGNISAFGLFTKESNALISGSGDIQTSVSDVLNVNIDGSGNVYYKGFPIINSQISGSGKIQNAN